MKTANIQHLAGQQLVFHSGSDGRGACGGGPVSLHCNLEGSHFT